MSWWCCGLVVGARYIYPPGDTYVTFCQGMATQHSLLTSVSCSQTKQCPLIARVWPHCLLLPHLTLCFMADANVYHKGAVCIEGVCFATLETKQNKTKKQISGPSCPGSEKHEGNEKKHEEGKKITIQCDILSFKYLVHNSN